MSYFSLYAGPSTKRYWKQQLSIYLVTSEGLFTYFHWLLLIFWGLDDIDLCACFLYYQHTHWQLLFWLHHLWSHIVIPFLIPVKIIPQHPVCWHFLMLLLSLHNLVSPILSEPMLVVVLATSHSFSIPYLDMMKMT